MGLLDPRQLSDLTTTAASAFDQTGIKVQHATRTKDNYGTFSETWSTRATVNGNYDKPTPKMMEQYAGIIGSQAAWIVRLPVGTQVVNDDRLLMPGGDTLTVQTVISARSYATCVMVLATEIR